MIRYNLLIIYRNFVNAKSTYLINLAGLTGGLVCSLLIYLWAHDELGVDRFHEKNDRLYQVMQKKLVPGGVLTLEDAPSLLAEALLDEMPEVEYATGSMSTYIWSNGDGIVSFDDNYFKARGNFVSSDFFDIFSFNMVEGPDKIFANRNSILISEELAEKVFGSTQGIVGKTLDWKDSRLEMPFIVEGVFETPKSNSTLDFDFLLSYDLYLENQQGADNWLNANPITYVVLKEGTDLETFNSKIEDFVQGKNPQAKNTLFAVNYGDLYLKGSFIDGIQSGGRIEYVRLFLTISFLVLVIACMNFMNLSTAKASTRMKEIGVKKAMGSTRRQLIIQFMEEAVMLTIVSAMIALFIVWLLLPAFNALVGKEISIQFDLQMLFTLLAIILTTGLLSGSYPAFYLSKFSPNNILKGVSDISKGDSWARQGLVIIQYTISVVLIISVFVIGDQIDLIRTKNLGYNKDNVFSFKAEGEVGRNFETFINELKKTPGVVGASSMYGTIIDGFGTTSSVRWEGQAPDEKIQFANQDVGFDFVETLGIEMKEGRAFSRDFSNERAKVIFNETAIDLMGIRNPVGKVIERGRAKLEIIGVAKDFHFESLYEGIKPCFLRFTNGGDNILVKIKAGTEQETLDRIGDLYDTFNKGRFPFEYRFLDQEYQNLYEAENTFATLSQIFTGLAVSISCLGLFGLASFSSQRRYKEISIRKALGSSSVGLIWLLLKDYTKIIFIAILLGSATSFYIMNTWLESFAYRIEMGIGLFILSTVITFGISWLTVGFNTFQATKVNVIENLRSE